MTDELALLIDGNRYTQWLSYECDAQLETPASAWSAAVRLEDAARPAGLLAWSWVEVLVGGTTVLSGRIDEIKTRYDRSHVTVTLRGRDQAALLLDASAKLSWGFSKTTMTQLLSTVAAAAGMTKTPATTDTGTFGCKAEPGESMWEFLSRVVERRGLRIWVAPDGTLHVGQYSTSGAPVAVLQRRLGSPAFMNNILGGAVTRSTLEVVSKVTVLGSWDHDTDTAGVTGVATNPEAPFTRELILVAGDVETSAEAELQAAEELSRRRARELVCRYTVVGHGDPAWAPNTLVALVDEREDLDELMLITGRRFTRSRQDGRRTELTLQRPEYFDAVA